MATEIQSWEIVNGQLKSVTQSLSEAGRLEKEHLELWIRSNPVILSDDLLIIGEQVQTASGPADFLAVDSDGNIVVVELKRDKLPREVIAQAIDYASDISSWDVEKIKEICMQHCGRPFEKVFEERFPEASLEDISINQVQRLLLVGFLLEDSTLRMIEWLSDTYNVGINAVLLSYMKTSSGSEVLSRSVVIPEQVEKAKANRKKFVIPKSNEPGAYDRDTLEKRLKEYLLKQHVSAQRIRQYLLPILLEKGAINRDELKAEFVARGGAPDVGKAGSFITLISSQLSFEWNDFLRQVVAYDFPKYPWEKDNYKIIEEYRELVTKVLEDLDTQEG